MTTVCPDLSTEKYVEQKMVCSTFTRSRVARTKGSIALSVPPQTISPPWIKEQAAHLIASC